MTDETLVSYLEEFKNLTQDQVAQARQQAKTRVLTSIGEQPVLSEYLSRAGDAPEPPKPQKGKWYQPFYGFGRFTNTMDALIPLLFLALGTISIIHMLSFSGSLASNIYPQQPTSFEGVWVSRVLFVVLHQASFFAFSELGILFFFSRWRITTQGRSLTALKKYLDVNLVLSVLCTLVSVYANVSSMLHNTSNESRIIGIIIGFLVPGITLILGERLTEIVLESRDLRRQELLNYNHDVERYQAEKQRLNELYREDYAKWVEDTTHPEEYRGRRSTDTYRHYLAMAIIDFYKRTAHGRDFPHWSSEFEVLLAARELVRLEGGLSQLDSAMSFFTKEPSSTPSHPQ